MYTFFSLNVSQLKGQNRPSLFWEQDERASEVKEESFIVPVLTGKINSMFWWEAATQALMSFDHTYSWGYEIYVPESTMQTCGYVCHVITATPKTSAEPHSCLMKCIVEFLPDPVASVIINWKDANEFIWRLRALRSQNFRTPMRWWWTADALHCLQLNFYMNSLPPAQAILRQLLLSERSLTYCKQWTGWVTLGYGRPQTSNKSLEFKRNFSWEHQVVYHR